MIYVTETSTTHRRQFWYKLFTDSHLDELHSFADNVGLRRQWFHRKHEPPCYLVSESIKEKCLKLGAKEINIHNAEGKAFANMLLKKFYPPINQVRMF